ncbi:MAG: DUF3783 domain-containing protein [Provencibacterium sp.]|jgi:hypothetical protein|nr:DUF3783 domain-containing protein [Provencibacterium sp.]
MKSRMPVNERVLCFHMGEQAGGFTALEKALESLSIPVRRLDGSCLDEKLGVLASPSFVPSEGSGTVQEEILRDALIFCFLTRARLNEALDALKRAGAESGALKAVLTEHNQNWSLRTLIGELEKEDALMSAYQQLHTLTKELLSVFEQSPNDRLAAALEQAQAALKAPSPSLQALQKAEAELRAAF